MDRPNHLARRAIGGRFLWKQLAMMRSRKSVPPASGGVKKPHRSCFQAPTEFTSQVTVEAADLEPDIRVSATPEAQAKVEILSKDYNKDKLIAIADNLISEADKLTNTYDCIKAGEKYLKAANLYRNASNYDKAIEAFKKASSRQEFSSYLAAKHLHSAAGLAIKLGNWTQVDHLYRTESKLYFEDGELPTKFVEPLIKGAQALNDVAPHLAIQLYTQVIAIHEEYEEYEISSLVYDDAINIHLKLHNYTDAAVLLARHNLHAGKSKANFLSAIVLYLYAQDFIQAEKCYNDCCQDKDFLGSEHNRCASALLSAYRKADTSEIKRVVQDSSCIKYLGDAILKLANNLPAANGVNVDLPLDMNDHIP